MEVVEAGREGREEVERMRGVRMVDARVRNADGEMRGEIEGLVPGHVRAYAGAEDVMESEVVTGWTRKLRLQTAEWIVWK